MAPNLVPTVSSKSDKCSQASPRDPGVLGRGLGRTIPCLIVSQDQILRATYFACVKIKVT